MMIFEYTHVGEALKDMPQHFISQGIGEDTRNGPVLSMPYPITLKTLRPRCRVLLCPIRKANPFLFLLDGLSILSKVDRVRPLSDIAPRFLSYSDDGHTLRGHYGRRLFAQIPIVVDMLRKDKTTRRASMNIFNPTMDLGTSSVDIPCNVQVNLRVIGNRLDLTVFNRSNDLFWGMLGANAVQFSFLQEYIAASAGLDIGHLYQISTNAHIYTGMGPGKGEMRFTSTPLHRYPRIEPLEPEGLVNDLDMMFLHLDHGELWEGTTHPFLVNVVYPMLRAWGDRNPDLLPEGRQDCDWFQAGRMYLNAINGVSKE